MKVKPFKEEVIELVLKFLQNQMGQAEIARKLRQKHIKDIPSWVLQNNELVKKGIAKVVKAYVQMDKNIKKYYVERKEPVEEAEAEEESQKQEEVKKQVKKTKNTRKVSTNSVDQVEKVSKKVQKAVAAPLEKNHHENTSTWVKNKFQPPKKLEEIGKDYEPVQKLKPLNTRHLAMIAKEASSEESSDRPLHSDHSESQQKVKKVKKTETKKVTKEVEVKPKKVKKAATSSQSSQQQETPEVKKPAPKDKKAVKNEKKQQKESEKQKQSKIEKSEEKPNKMRTRSDDKIEVQYQEPFQNNNNNNFNGQKKGHTSTFSRIKVDQVGPIPVMLQDNSFQAKFKYGKGGDQWGRYGHERLKDTRGDSFKKTKDKLKNKAYQGGNIDFNVINSIPID